MIVLKIFYKTKISSSFSKILDICVNKLSISDSSIILGTNYLTKISFSFSNSSKDILLLS